MSRLLDVQNDALAACGRYRKKRMVFGLWIIIAFRFNWNHPAGCHQQLSRQAE
jgi:hypothetical protein